MVLCERSCHKEYACAISKVMAKVMKFLFTHSAWTRMPTRTLAPLLTS